MKIYSLIVLLAVMVQVEAAKPDFSLNTWKVRHTQWKKFPQLALGIRFFAQQCLVRFGDPKNERRDGNFKIEWINDSSFKIFGKRQGKNKKGKERTGWKTKFRTIKIKGSTATMTMWEEQRRTVKLWGQKFIQKHYFTFWNTDTVTVYGGDATLCSTTTNTFTTDTFKRTIVKKSDKIFDKCGSGVSDTCVGRTVEMSDEGFQDIISEAVDGATFLLKGAVVTMATELSTGMIRGCNAARCALVAGGDNFWQLLAAIYYLALEFEYAAEVEKYINQIYPYECTCTEEIQEIQKSIGGKKLALTVMKGCSEKVQVFAAETAQVEEGGIPQDSVDEEELNDETD